jgi:hypothetical protein
MPLSSRLEGFCVENIHRTPYMPGMQTVEHDSWYLEEQRRNEGHSRRRPPAPARILGRVEADPRKALMTAAAARKVTLAALSRMLDRPEGYLGRFTRGEHPKALTAAEHKTLAQFFGVDERALGVRALWLPL